MISHSLLQAARDAHQNGLYHEARDLYQMVAYSYNDFTELEKEAFTKEVSEFAGDDPMYHDILQLVISHITRSSEPVLQSQITKVIKEGYGERGAELLRYVLYYADYRDELRRIKKGRSYILLLPHQLPPDTPREALSPPKKTQRKKATTTPKITVAPSRKRRSSSPQSFVKGVKRSYKKTQNDIQEAIIGIAIIVGIIVWLFS